MSDGRPRFPLGEGSRGVGAATPGKPSSGPGLELPEGALELAPLQEEEMQPSPSRETRPSQGGGVPGSVSTSHGPPSFQDAAPLELDHARGPGRGMAAGPSPSPSAPSSPANGPPQGAQAAASPPSSLVPRGGGRTSVRREEEVAQCPSATASEEAAQAGRRRVIVLGGVLGGVAALAAVYYGMGWHKEKPPARRKRPRQEVEDDSADAPGPPASRPVVPADLPPPQEVQILFDVTPRGAVLLVRGREVPGHSLLVPFGDKPIEVRFEAKGHAPEVVTVVPDQNRTVPVRLMPRP